MHQLPITEKEISDWTSVPVFSPILCANLSFLGIEPDSFIDFFKDCFKSMPFDFYDVKIRQWDLLPNEIKANQFEAFKNYYLNPDGNLLNFVDELGLNIADFPALKSIQPWRRRSVCTFELELGEEIIVNRIFPLGFEQAMDKTDIRSLPRIFAETNSEIVENSVFFGFLKAIANYSQQITPHVEIKKMRITAHFMSVRAKPKFPGNNSPEGAHEDGADFIVSALVINRKGILGGKSQVLEKMSNGELVNIFEHELQEGEFLFQADTGEEKHYGNDLWHHVTPFTVDPSKEEAWREIIGLDISILQSKI